MSNFGTVSMFLPSDVLNIPLSCLHEKGVFVELLQVEHRALIAAEGFQASSAAMEEEKLQLVREIKMLQAQLASTQDASKGSDMQV